MSDRHGFDKIIGQQMAKHILARAAREGEPTHAYLFLGLEGTGKLTTAVEFAKALNCEDPRDGNACGECALCHSIEHGNMPEVRIWSVPKNKQDTTIEQMREMRDLAMLRPLRARWKTNIVEQGDTLNDESANCILKLLEEPPDYLINILLFRNAASVLPTVRSRCQLVRFTQVNAAELVDRLMDDYGVGNDEARFLATYSQGCPGKAIRLIGDEAFVERRNAIIEVASGASSQHPWLALKLAEALRGPAQKSADEDEEGEVAEDEPADQPKQPRRSKRDTTLESLDMLLLWYRDLLAAKLQGSDAAIVNVDKRDEVNAQAMAYPHGGRLLTAVQAIQDSKQIILGNGNPQIVTEALMMRLAG